MRTMGKTGEGTLAWLRERNRQRVLGALRERGPTSQADIARATGLSRTTVSKLVGELKVSGVVDSLEVRRPASRGVRGGRPSLQLALRESTKQASQTPLARVLRLRSQTTVFTDVRLT